MKQTLTLLGVMLLLLHTACKDFLDKKPLGETLAGDITTQEQAILFTNATYEPLLWGRDDAMQGHYFNDMWILGDLPSDDTESPVDPNNFSERALQDFSIFPDNPNLKDWFGSAYAGIARCNLVIDNVARMPDAVFRTPGLKQRCLGEAYFLRAFYYFDLVKVFGGVPLADKPIKTVAETKIPRASAEQVWQFIESDLIKAAELLPSVKMYRNTADLGRASAGAAQALLAKVYLYQRKWSQATAAAELVIQGNEYELNPDYLSQFNDQNNQNGIESIFEVQAFQTKGWSSGTEISLDFGRWGFNNPTKEFVEEFEPGDPRLKWTVFSPGDDRFGEPYDGKGKSVTGYLARKYVYDPASVGEPKEGWTNGEGVNYVVLRFAEVLLIHAESLIEQGIRLEEAWADINRVRARPGVNMPPIALSDQATLRAALRHERRVEMGLEGQRYFDMIRWGSDYATPRLRAQGKTAFDFDTHQQFPLPQSELDLNPLLK